MTTWPMYDPEDQPNANQVVVLSFAAWKRLFGQDPGILARTIELNEHARRELTTKGVRAVNLTAANRLKFVEAVQPAYASTIDGVLTHELVQKLRDTKDAATSPLIPEAIARTERLKAGAAN